MPWIPNAALQRLGAMCRSGADREPLRTARAGELLGDRFLLEVRLGSGGSGTVYRAIDRARDLPVAVKVFRYGEPAARARFQREASALAGLVHPGIVRYVAHGIADSGEPYLCTELVEGVTLAQRLRRARLSIDDAVAIVLRLAATLGHVHERGIVHRDLTPGNVLLRSGNVADPVLLDFGLARTARHPLGTVDGPAVVGTPGYMAPEQARAAGEVDARSDVFALGCILYECCAGRPAFAGDGYAALLTKILFESPPPLADLVPGIPAQLATLVERMLAKDPRARPADARAAAEALSAVPPEHAESLARHSPVLTADEQRLVAVVLANRPLEAYLAARQDWSDEEGPTFTQQDVEDMFVHLRALARPFGGALEALADGSLVGTFVGTGTSITDQAVAAARCAMALRAAMPLAPMALAMGRAQLDGRLAMGEVIDRAGRLAADIAPPSGIDAQAMIRVDTLAADLLRDRIEVRTEGAEHRLAGPRAAQDTDAPRTLLGRVAPFVGREVELAMLRGIYSACVDERSARAAVVTGPAGVGKSRLRAEFLASLRHDAARVREHGGRELEIWTARGDPVNAGSPFAIASQLIARAMGLEGGDPPAIARHKVLARLGRHFQGEELRRIAEFLGELAGVRLAEHPSVQLRAARQDPILMTDQIRAAWEDWLRAECEQRPVVIAVDDQQWGDLPTVNLLDAALRGARSAPLMVLLLGRPELETVFPRLLSDRTVGEIRLGPLSRGAGAELVRQVLGEQAGEDALGWILDHADGNPLYFEELIRAAARGAAPELPGTLTAMVQARVEALEPELRRVLRAASVFGDDFSEPGLRALLGDRAGHDLNADLRRLVELEVLSPRRARALDGGTEYAFRHPLLREASYAMLTDSDRSLGHGVVGDWLAKRGQQEPIVVARHYERSAEPTRAVPWLCRAAQAAFEATDLQLAISRAERAVIHGAAGETLGVLRSIQAEAHRWTGDVAKGQLCSLEAIALLPRGSSRWFAALRQALGTSAILGDRDRYQHLSKELVAALEVGPLGVQAVRAACGAAVHLLLAGDRHPALALLGRVSGAARTVLEDDPATRGSYIYARAVAAGVEGDMAQRLALQEECVTIYERAGDLRTLSVTHSGAGYAYLVIGCNRLAEAHLRKALAITERMRITTALASVKHNLGLALARRGALEAARVLQQEAIAIAHGSDPRTEAGARVYLSVIDLASGDAVAAEREAREAAALSTSFAPTRAAALAELSRALVEQRRTDEALAVAAEATRVLDACGPESEAPVRLAWADALAATGQHALAREAIAVARERLLTRAAKLTDPSHRQAFLENVPDHARTLALARQWIGP